MVIMLLEGADGVLRVVLSASSVIPWDAMSEWEFPSASLDPRKFHSWLCAQRNCAKKPATVPRISARRVMHPVIAYPPNTSTWFAQGLRCARTDALKCLMPAGSSWKCLNPPAPDLLRACLDGLSPTPRPWNGALWLQNYLQGQVATGIGGAGHRR